MEIKTTPRRNISSRKLFPFSGKRRLLLLFITYNIIIASVGIFLFYSEVHFSRRQRIVDRFLASTNIENIVKKARYTLGGKTRNPEQLIIDIKAEDVQILDGMKASFLQKGFPFNAEEKGVPATIRHEAREYHVEISVKRSWKDHWQEEGMAPLQLTLKDAKPLLGMKFFFLYPTQTEGLVNKWLNQKLFAYAGLISPYFDLVAVDVNGGGSSYYAIEQKVGKRFGNSQFEQGPILRFFEDSYWNIESENSVPAKIKARQLMEDFQEAKLSVREVFNVNKLATYFALIEFLGGHQPSAFDNIAFYYNPLTGLLEPIRQNNIHPGYLGRNGLAGAEIQIAKPPLKTLARRQWEHPRWYETVFSDKIFYEAYIDELERMSADGFLDGFFRDNEGPLIKNMKIFGLEGYSDNLDFIQLLFENRDYVRQVLNPEKIIHSYYEKNISARQLHLKISNIHNLPLEILGADIGDSIMLSLSNPSGLVQANIQLTPVTSHTFSFNMPDNISWVDSMLTGLSVHASVLGSGRIIDDAVNPYSLFNPAFLENDLIRQKPNAGDFDFLVVDEQKKHIRFKKGSHRLNKNLVIPKGYKVFAQEGTRVNMTNSANILSYSPIYFKGSREHPVSFYSADSTAQGITIMQAPEESLLQGVHFDNLSNPMQSGWSLTSAITFYESPLKIDSCYFGNNRRGDDYLNIVRAGFSIDNSLFNNAVADAFDCDFCTGSIKNTQFINSGNDAIDISGSNISVENLLIDKVGDKGISVGENSTMEGKKVVIKNAEIAVTSKDFSRILIDDIAIKNSRIAYAAFQKKSEFGPASIEVPKTSTISGQVEIAYLIEEGSTLKIADKKVKPSIDITHVKRILYGVKFGISSDVNEQ